RPFTPRARKLDDQRPRWSTGRPRRQPPPRHRRHAPSSVRPGRTNQLRGVDWSIEKAARLGENSEGERPADSGCLDVTACTLGVSASAAPSLRGTTTTTVTSDVVLHSHIADGNLITDEAVTAKLRGAFTGRSKFTLHVVTHGDGSR